MRTLRFRPNPALLAAAILGLGTLSGWGAYAVSSSGKTALRAQLAETEGQRDALAARFKQFQDVEAELRDRQAKIAATRDEIAQLGTTRDKAKAQLTATQRDLASLTKRLDQAKDKVTQTGSITPAAAAEPAKKPAR
jgi:chromosome segregation ATPase